eukprot:10045865-Ditylum_brightwellii.AAC.1
MEVGALLCRFNALYGTPEDHDGQVTVAQGGGHRAGYRMFGLECDGDDCPLLSAQLLLSGVP